MLKIQILSAGKNLIPALKTRLETQASTSSATDPKQTGLKAEPTPKSLVKLGRGNGDESHLQRLDQQQPRSRPQPSPNPR